MARHPNEGVVQVGGAVLPHYMARHGDGHHQLGTTSSRKEAAVIATILRLFNPN